MLLRKNKRYAVTAKRKAADNPRFKTAEFSAHTKEEAAKKFYDVYGTMCWYVFSVEESPQVGIINAFEAPIIIDTSEALCYG